MEKYISKSAVAAELEKRKNQFVSQAESFRKIGKKKQESYFAALASNMNSLSCFIDSLETKEVDLEKEFYDFLDTLTGKDNGHLSEDELFRIAEYFYELGLIQKGE